MNKVFPQHRPAIIAHRGVSSRAIENSIRAFELAVENPWGRCDAIELDVHTTEDGEIVVHHDPTLASGRKISTSTSLEVRQELLADGSRIPTLADVLAISGRLTVHIEVKGVEARYDEVLLSAIRGAPHPELCQIHGFDHRVVARLGAQAPELTTGVLSSSYPLDQVAPVVAAGASVLWQEESLIDEALVARCRAAGIGVIAWTVNDAERAVELVGMGVAGLCGNWPERLEGIGNRTSDVGNA